MRRWARTMLLPGFDLRIFPKYLKNLFAPCRPVFAFEFTRSFQFLVRSKLAGTSFEAAETRAKQTRWSGNGYRTLPKQTRSAKIGTRHL